MHQQAFLLSGANWELDANTSIDFYSDDWYRTFGLTEWQYIPDNNDSPPVDAPLTSSVEGATKVEQSRSVRDAVINLTSSDRMYTPTKVIDLTKDCNHDYPGCVPTILLA